MRFSHNADDSGSNSHPSDLKLELKFMSKFEMQDFLQYSAVKGWIATVCHLHIDMIFQILGAHSLASFLHF